MDLRGWRTWPRAAIVLVALVALPANAQESVPLTAQYETEGKYTVHATSRYELDLTTTDPEIKRSSTDPEIKRSSHSLVQSREEKYTREFVEIRDGVPTKQNLVYLVSREAVTREVGQRPEPQPTELENKSFQVVAQGDGQSVECTNGSVSDNALQMVQARERCLALLPNRSVAVGDSWNVEGADACRFLVDAYSILPDQESMITCTLREVRSEGTSTMADISISIAVKGKSKPEAGGDGYALALNMAGQMRFDATLGRPRSVSLDGTLKVNGSKTDAAGEKLLAVEGNGTIKLEIEFQ